MSVLLYRVDERLVHGQVVLGWGSRLRPDGYLVVDDELAQSQWEQEIYRAGLPDEVRARFVSIADARRSMQEYRDTSERWIVLTRDVGTMGHLAEGRFLAGEVVNLGGIYAGPDRRERVAYVHLSDAEAEALRAMEGEGVEVKAQDLPGSRQVPLPTLLR